MFQYTHEVIINSMIADADAYGSTDTKPKLIAEPGVLTILRGGEYKLENIQDTRIYKTPGYRGVTGGVEIPLTSGGNSIFTQVGIYRLTIVLESKNKYKGDYANAAWYLFGKPIQVEVEVTAANNNMSTFDAYLAQAINLAIPYNDLFARAVADNSGVHVQLTDPYDQVKWAFWEYFDPTADCDYCGSGNYVQFPTGTNLITIEPNTEPFATGEWMQENLRFPSYPNRRYAGLYEDEYPIVGQLYTQYSFAYDVERKGYYGISGVNQKMEAVTRHIYWVLNSLVDEFEELVNDAFGDNVIVENNTVIIVSAGTLANDGITVRLAADTYPTDDTATFTWAFVNADGSNASAPTGVTMANGAITADPDDAVVGSSFYVQATSSNGDYTPAIKKITIVQG